MQLYRIRDWDLHFENAQSRKVESLRWVPLPVKHDGLGYRRLIGMPGGAELYGAWVLIVQVSAKCPLRGTLADERGPLDAGSLSLKTGCPAIVFAKALKVLSTKEIGWLLVEEWEPAGSAPAPEGREGMEWNGMEWKKDAPAKAGCPSDLLVWIDWWNRLRAESLVPHGADSDPPSQAVLKAWASVQRNKVLRDLFAETTGLEIEIRAASFCREGWFRLERLLGGKNRDGELIARKLLDGGYRDTKPLGGQRGKPPSGPGQRYSGKALDPI